MDVVEFTFNNILPFNLSIVVDGGQAFRWEKSDSEFSGKVSQEMGCDCNSDKSSYIGVIGPRAVKVTQEGNRLKVVAFTFLEESLQDKEKTVEITRDYFDLNRDYAAIEDYLCKFEELIPAVKYCSGNRILHQDPWETTISFIISANNSIRNIKSTVERMCEFFGKPLEYPSPSKVPDDKKKPFYSFPTPEALASLTEEDLRKTRCGFRAKYILQVAKMVASGEIDIYGLEKLPTSEARQKLMKLPGVGGKVADCILLFSLRKFDAFPVDVWIKRVLEHLYFEGKEMPIKYLRDFAEKRFGSMAGFAQQYLFHYTRTFWGQREFTT